VGVSWRLSTEAVADAFEALLGVRQLHFEQEPTVRSALGLHRKGMDFADALQHLGSGSCAVLLSFDRALILQVERLQLRPPVQAP
jgi:predicted nucleic-acid-binding protein